jgi:hypothetical protein
MQGARGRERKKVGPDGKSVGTVELFRARLNRSLSILAEAARDVEKPSTTKGTKVHEVGRGKSFTHCDGLIES